MNEYKRIYILIGLLVFLLFIFILFKEPLLELFDLLMEKLELHSI